MTTTRKMRLSPSGEFIGDPGLRVGPGSTGVIFRAHGSGDSVATMNASTDTTPAPVVTFPVDLQPGYKYETKLYAEYQGAGMTVTAQVHVLYHTRDFSTQVWGPWTRLTGSDATPVNHYVHAAPTTAEAPTGAFEECLIDLAVTSRQDVIEFALVTTYDSGQPGYRAGRVFAIVSEYVV